MSSSSGVADSVLGPPSYRELIAPFLRSANVLEPHEGDESQQLVRSVAQADLAIVSLRGELKPSEGVDRHRVGVDTCHLAEKEVRASLGQQGADTVAEPGQVGAGDRAADGKGDRVRPYRGHRNGRPPGTEKLIGGDR
jgi:hypothetical protein